MPEPNPPQVVAPAQQVIDQVKTFTKRFNWRALYARVLYWAWSVFMKAVLFIVYFALISLGFLHVYPDTGQRLFRLPIPGFAELENYEWTYNLRLAHLCSIVLLVLTWFSWNLLLRLFLSDDLVTRFQRWNWNVRWVKGILIVGAALIVIGDAGLFYSALQYAAFGESTFSAFTFVATLVWVVILVLVNFISIFLSRCVTDELKKAEEQS